MLEQERQFYTANLNDWLSRYPGKFVVITGQDLIGFYDTMEDALTEGARRVGLQPFLVRRVERKPDEISVPALTLGILSGDTTHPDWR